MRSIEYVYDGIPTGYIINENGDVYSTKSNSDIHPWKNNSGYKYFSITIDGVNRNIAIHRAVAEMFIPNPENKPQVNHIDGNKDNNHASNLEWVTQSENNHHAFKIGLRQAKNGDQVHFSKYKSSQIIKACAAMEENKKSLFEIQEITGVPIKTLNEIRAGGIWQSIAKDFNFPKNPIRAPRGNNISYQQQKDLIKLAKTDMSANEIAKELKLEMSKMIYNKVYWYRHKNKD